jgi:hypothetical protein
MTDPHVRIVDNALRERVGIRDLSGRKPEYDALMDGKTVFFPLNGEESHRLGNRIRNAITARGKACTVRQITIDDERGLIAWTTGEFPSKRTGR